MRIKPYLLLHFDVKLCLLHCIKFKNLKHFQYVTVCHWLEKRQMLDTYKMIHWATFHGRDNYMTLLYISLSNSISSVLQFMFILIAIYKSPPSTPINTNNSMIEKSLFVYCCNLFIDHLIIDKSCLLICRNQIKVNGVKIGMMVLMAAEQ